MSKHPIFQVFALFLLASQSTIASAEDPPQKQLETNKPSVSRSKENSEHQGHDRTATSLADGKTEKALQIRALQRLGYINSELAQAEANAADKLADLMRSKYECSILECLGKPVQKFTRPANNTFGKADFFMLYNYGMGGIPVLASFQNLQCNYAKRLNQSEYENLLKARILAFKNIEGKKWEQVSKLEPYPDEISPTADGQIIKYNIANQTTVVLLVKNGICTKCSMMTLVGGPNR